VVADFLGDFRPDFWVSDRYGGQMGWAAVNNQVCLARLIRDVQYAIDAGDDIFAPFRQRLWHHISGAMQNGFPPCRSPTTSRV
jgi:transposase